MPNRVKRVGCGVGVLLLAACVPCSVLAEAGALEEAERWVPALSLSSGFLLQDAEASIQTSSVLGPPRPLMLSNSRESIRPDDSGNALMITPDVGVALELMTPRVAAAAWAPRFFAHAGVSGAFGPKRDIAKEGVIEPLTLSPLLLAPDEDDVAGQGSRTRVLVETLLVRAGAGIVFSVDAFGRRFRVRTSIEYLREGIEVQGASRRAVCTRSVAAAPNECGARREGLDSDYREIDLRRTETKDFHGIGPGFELESDVGRIGPLVPSIGIGVQAFHFLGNREVAFSASNEYGETATAYFRKDPWAYRAGVGVRFRWIPE